MSISNTQVRNFGKLETKVGRRMAVVLGTGESVEEARPRPNKQRQKLSFTYG
ncbi:hypothetical protein ACSU64_21695 [Bacillaceae bacterium C204]|uniref:hypothetical protein n=1 Tax=Neobacillus sp. 204 TaxID=3383351 RepID=UPI0039786E75